MVSPVTTDYVGVVVRARTVERVIIPDRLTDLDRQVLRPGEVMRLVPYSAYCRFTDSGALARYLGL